MDYRRVLKKHNPSFEEISKNGQELLSHLKRDLEKSSLISIHDIDDSTFEFSFWNVWYKAEVELVVFEFNSNQDELVFEGEINTYMNYEDEDKANIEPIHSIRFDKHGNLKNNHQEISTGYIEEFMNALLEYHAVNKTKFPIK